MSSMEQLVSRQVDRWNLQTKVAATPPMNREEESQQEPNPHITLSRERGAGGLEVARLLGEHLGWAVLDRELADLVAQNMQVRRRLMDTVDERFRGQIDTYLHSLLVGESTDSTVYARHMGRALHVYLQHDPAIIVGRGANILLKDHRASGLHVRIVAPFEWRVRHTVMVDSLSEREARETVRRADGERAGFVKSAFGRDVADPLMYDLLINRGTLPSEDARESEFAGSLFGVVQGAVSLGAEQVARLILTTARLKGIL